jgi:hypothetical protein
MEVAVSRRKVQDDDGTREITTRAFHCEVCGAFIRSEDAPGSEDSPDDS